MNLSKFQEDQQHEQHEYSEIQHDLSRRERALREELGNVMRLQFPHFVHLTRDTSSTLDDLQLLCSQLRAWCADSKAITASVVERVAAYDVPMRRRERITAHLKELQHLRRLAEALGNVEALLPSIQKVVLAHTSSCCLFQNSDPTACDRSFRSRNRPATSVNC